MTSQGDNFVVGFDMDGVIIDHTQNKLSLAKRYGITLRPAETHSEVISRHIPMGLYAAFQEELYDDSDFALSAPLMEGALATLTELKDKEIPFVLISRRRKPANAIKLLTGRGLWGSIFDETNTMFGEENTMFVRTPEQKNIVARGWNVTHYIDDEYKVLQVMPDVRARFLFDSFDQFGDKREFPRILNWAMLREVLFVPRRQGA